MQALSVPTPQGMLLHLTDCLAWLTCCCASNKVQGLGGGLVPTALAGHPRPGMRLSVTDLMLFVCVCTAAGKKWKRRHALSWGCWPSSRSTSTRLQTAALFLGL